MLAGELYAAGDPELAESRVRARALTARFNAGEDVLGELLGRLGEGVTIEPPFHCDYGWNITMGDGSFVNFNGVFLDCAPIEIGELTLLGPNVQLSAATHPVDPRERETGLELARPIRIGRNVWIGAGVIVGPGVTIGDDTVIGAGSVVVKDVPERVVAVGNPCRVIREL